MRAFSAGEISRMQGVQEAALMDQCELLQRADGTADAYGIPTPGYTVVATVACGLEHSAIKVDTSNEAGGSERLGTQAPTEERFLRLPRDLQVSNADRVRITRRFGAKVTPVTYELIGMPQMGPSGLLVRIQRVTE